MDTWSESLTLVQRALVATLPELQSLEQDNWLEKTLYLLLPHPWDREVFLSLLLRELASREEALWFVAQNVLSEMSFGTTTGREMVQQVESLLTKPDQILADVSFGTVRRTRKSGWWKRPTFSQELQGQTEDIADVRIEPAIQAEIVALPDWPGVSALPPAEELGVLGWNLPIAAPAPAVKNIGKLVSPGLEALGAKLAARPSNFSHPSGWPGSTVVRVFYATDREEEAGTNSDVRYNSRRSKQEILHYGRCEVSIPKDHTLGRLESSSILRLEFRPNREKHIVLVKTESLAEEVFFGEVKAAVEGSPAKDAFVFVHGYNVSFEDAARRIGQMTFDLKFDGAPILYSWPSQGLVTNYFEDETSIIWTTEHLERFLLLLTQSSGAERIHLIVHSMGNRAVCDALKAMNGRLSGSLKFEHLMLAAPDIDADTFEQVSIALRTISGRVTLYESSNDKAIRASRKIHGRPRAGEPLLVLEGVDTVDVSAIDTDFLGHSYFSDTFPLLSDMHALIANDEAPAKRVGLREQEQNGRKYYVFQS